MAGALDHRSAAASRASAAEPGASSSVLLGFPDGVVSDEWDRKFGDHTLNVIGGKPHWHPGVAVLPSAADLSCPLCRGPCPMSLVAQIYAPVDEAYHRTLYVFACLNPPCWNESKSWKCVRMQSPASEATAMSAAAVTSAAATKTTDWLSGADDWGDEDDWDSGGAAATLEENGNVVGLDNDPKAVLARISANKNLNLNRNLLEKMTLSDNPTAAAAVSSPSPADDGRSLSSSSTSSGLSAAAAVASEGAAAASDPNANASAGARGQAVQEASAEIEDDEDTPDESVVAVDFEADQALVEATEIPNLFTKPHNNRSGGGSRCATPRSFAPLFLAVEEERKKPAGAGALTDHERRLLREYSDKEAKSGGGGAGSLDSSADGYEKVLPKHGDALFHKLVSAVQENPGQVVRYTRNPSSASGQPLYLRRPEEDLTRAKCEYCAGPLIPEVQILSTLIPSLRLLSDGTPEVDGSSAPLEFGTSVVFACQRSCWRPGEGQDCFKFERVLVQEEAVM